VYLCTFTADGALSAKIAEEFAYEKEAATEGEPDFLKAVQELWYLDGMSYFPLPSWCESGLLSGERRASI
jgi:hypothetical protein